MMKPLPTALLVQALWNQRLAGLFFLGPPISVTLVGIIFHLPDNLELIALGMFLLTMTLFGILVRGECRNLRSLPALEYSGRVPEA